MASQEDVPELIGVSQHIEDLREHIEDLEGKDLTVLIQGPTGTGKEVVAKNIHSRSKRSLEPFVDIDCGTIPTELFESEFFGYERGAFTGATHDKPGKVAEADNGTLFLDEIGNLRPDHQAKVLRFLQGGSYSPLGGKIKRADVRIIAATNKDLREELKKGNFREDLYYRLSGYEIHTRPLKDRPEDLVCLVNHFFEGRQLTVEEAKLRFLLYSHSFPGNVRELKKLRERGFKQVLQGLKTDWQTEMESTSPPMKLHESRLRSIDLVQNLGGMSIKNAVRAYEIITLYQNTQLSKKDIVEILRIRKDRLDPGTFKSTHGFKFPDRNRRYNVSLPCEVLDGVEKKDPPDLVEDRSAYVREMMADRDRRKGFV